MASAQARRFKCFGLIHLVLALSFAARSSTLFAHGMAAQDSSFLQNLDHAHWPLLAYLGHS